MKTATGIGIFLFLVMTAPSAAYEYNGGFTPAGEISNSLLLAAVLDGAYGDGDFTHSWANGFTQVFTAGTITALKGLTNRDRPDGQSSDRWNSSFPSGHAGVAFGYAGALGSIHHELRLPLLTVGVLVSRQRVLDDRHRLGECFVGGFIGYAWGLHWGHRAIRRRDRLREGRRRHRLARRLLPGLVLAAASRATEGRVPGPSVAFRF